MEKKFIKLMESNITRSTRGGFLVGDYVEFLKNYKSKRQYKELNDSMKDAVDHLANTELHVRVVGVNDTKSTRFQGNPDEMTGNVVLSLAEDQGGGRIYHNVLVPSSLCKVKDFYPNYAPLPAVWSYDNKEIHKPVEVKQVDSGSSGIDYALPTKDTKIKPSSTSKKKKKKVSVKINKESYTAGYLSGMEYLR